MSDDHPSTSGLIINAAISVTALLIIIAGASWFSFREGKVQGRFYALQEAKATQAYMAEIDACLRCGQCDGYSTPPAGEDG